jgi:hypothetical protein
MILLARVDTFRGGMGQQFCITKKKTISNFFKKLNKNLCSVLVDFGIDVSIWVKS